MKKFPERWPLASAAISMVGPGCEVRLRPDGTPRFYVQQQRSELRKGERLRVFHAMKHLGLDDLLVAGGEGSALRTRALRTAINDFARHRQL
jgi:hypothetical protein